MTQVAPALSRVSMTRDHVKLSPRDWTTSQIFRSEKASEIAPAIKSTVLNTSASNSACAACRATNFDFRFSAKKAIGPKKGNGMLTRWHKAAVCRSSGVVGRFTVTGKRECLLLRCAWAITAYL